MEAQSSYQPPGQPGTPGTQSPVPQGIPARPLIWISTLVLGYIGIYLCRKNLAVAVPMLREQFGVSRDELGKIASYSTAAYVVGKFVFGPVVDGLGGRKGFLASLFAVALFGAAGAFAPGIGMLALFYSCNRLMGAAGWPAMVKQVPDWFEEKTMPLAMAVLSLSFVFGGVCATLFAGQVAEWSGDNWRAVMGAPSAVLIAILLVGWFVLPRPQPVLDSPDGSAPTSGFRLREIWDLFSIRRLWIVCSLSFTLTLLRETFNFWTVDFFRTEGGAAVSNRIAAFLSTPFDALGAVGIITLGWIFGRISKRARGQLLCLILLLLTGLIYALPILFRFGLWPVTVAIGLIGFLVYGPYSLLAGVLSLEIRGKEYVGTVSGIVDGVGYMGGFLAGQQFGRIVELGGYRLGFQVLSILALISACLCLALYPRTARD
ncbi:MAG: MFS transporter [Pedosphaera sp.]|nr:MFS transporter [Pedosphaera sp.]